MPKVTVVTAAKNAAEFLPDAIDSVRRQSFTDWQHVIVDDGSTDDTATVVQRYAGSDPRIRLVSLPDSIGPYAAANRALLVADSQYLARLDADDVALPDRLQLQVDQLDRAGPGTASVGGWRWLRAEPREGEHIHTVPTQSNGVMRWMLCVRGGPLHSTLMIDAALFRELGGYGPERVAEDYRLWCKLSRRDALRIRNRALVLYRKHDQQITAKVGNRDDAPRLRVRLEHLRAMAPHEDWSEADARDFRYVGEVAPFGLPRALDLLRRWRSAWSGDDSLSASDRNELRSHAAQLTLVHMWALGRRSRLDAAVAMAGHPGLALGSVVRLQRYGYRRW